MPINKIVLRVTVLAQDDTLEQSVNSIGDMSLESLARSMSEGDLIGTYSIQSSETVEPEKVVDELLAIGNDGTFFYDEFVFADGEPL